MDSLEDFEKSLAAEKAQREDAEQRHRQHRHRHHHRSLDEDDEDREGRERRGRRDRERGDGKDREGHRHREREGEQDNGKSREGHRHRERERDDEKDRDRHRHRRRRSKERDEQGENHHHRRHRQQEGDEVEGGNGEDRHRDKRSRRSHGGEHSDDEGRHRHRHRHHRERERDAEEEDEGKHQKKDNSQETQGKAPVRDAWMTDPMAFEVEHVQRKPEAKPGKSPTPELSQRAIHSRELNTAHLQALNSGKAPEEDTPCPALRTVDYVFGDAGSTWRMTKLKAVYETAEDSGRTVEEVALQRFGSLEFFDDAREEQEELERRRLYGEGYGQRREKPSGELYRERTRSHFRESERSPSAPMPGVGVVQTMQTQTQPVAAAPVLDQTALNRLRAQMMKAKLRRAPDAAKLEEEYDRAAAAAAAAAAAEAGHGDSAPLSAPEAVVLGAMESRLLAGPRGEVSAVDTRRGRERGLVQEKADMSLDDMLREERRTKGQPGGEGMRLAERIARDARFADDLEYMDDNAEKLARRVHRSDVNLKNVAVHEFQRLSRILDSCPLCHRDDDHRQGGQTENQTQTGNLAPTPTLTPTPSSTPPLAPVVSLATRVFLSLPTEPEVSPGGALIAPLAHHTNLLECDDDEWEEIRNFMKSLTRMFHDQGRDVLFYENAAHPLRRRHAAMLAVPIPYDEGATAPAFFREAFLAADEEWSQHRKVVDTAARAREGGMGRAAFRRSFAKEAPYFHVWFGIDGGLGHVVENADKWPKGDLFAREVIGGIVDAEPHVVKKQGRWSRSDGRVEGFRKGWRKFDWTRVLTEEA